jgi:1-pyrroline-5-carboxylate dehydrogenase
MLPDFRNEPFTDFSIPAKNQAMKDALALVKTQLGKTYPLIIGGERIETNDYLISTNPAEPSQEVGRFSKANTELAEKAIQSALKAFDSWSRVAPTERARYLFKVASMMRTRKFELAAWLVYEIGKSWAEADADVAEAIDFAEFYGREMVRLSLPQPLTANGGEENELYYIPLGVGVVIPPWNFALAILVGMTTAAIVTGNTVVLKPSSETPAIAYKFACLMEEAGLPKGVLNFLPGPGSSVGDFLISHPKTRFVAFTGSKEVGLRINELAARHQNGQLWVKRVIAEMGGKDSIIVDENADLDSAADGVVASAFGFQGQKCSACSRVIIHERIYDDLVKKIVERTNQLTIGNTTDQKNHLGPVASKSAYESIREYIQIGKGEGKQVTGLNDTVNGGGYFIPPTVFEGVAPEARISQEEIFGPVLAVIKAKDWDDALSIANNTEFGLTGGVYSRDRTHIEQARRDFHVGNLYVNRKCTGALVGVHPFGGFNMSGTDSKAGGRDYLLLFTQAKVVSEKY